MRTETKTAFAVLLTAVLATGAFAQAAKDDNAAGANANAAASADTSMSDGDFTTYGQVISSLNTDMSATEGSDPFADVTSDATVNFVLLSELNGEGADNAQSLDQALADKSAELEQVREKISNNETLSSALDEHGYTADQVVAWNVGTDGTVTLVIDDRT